MQATRLTVLASLALAACSPVAPSGETPQQRIAAQLSPAQKVAIGQKIWNNECGGSIEGLTTWNLGENFPSLGIGHFIWYPEGVNGRFKESWPDFVAFAAERGVQAPDIARKTDCPWPTREAFLQQFKGSEMRALRRWLLIHVSLQTDFIIARSDAALPKILEAAPAGERKRIAANYEKVASTPQGVYALIDYVNFKGDGTDPAERYRGHGWGLLQVLGAMREVPAGPAAGREFGASAIRMLERRIANAPPERGESRWMAGWRNRCLTYGRAL